MSPSLRRWSAQALLSALGVGAGAAVLTIVYHIGVNAIGRAPPTVLEIYVWEAAVWAPWVFIAPWIIRTSERIAERGKGRAAVFAVHAALALGVVSAHALWFTWISAHLSPYVTFRELWSALLAYLRGGLALSLLLYAVLSVWASRNHAVVAVERRFREFIENAVVGIFRTTPDGTFLLLNQAGAEILGYDSPDEAVQQVADISMHYTNPTDRRRYLGIIREEGRVDGWITEMQRQDGTRIWVNENARGVFDDGGLLLYVEGTLRDVTDELAAQEALRASELRAAELRAQLADAQLRALRLQLQPHFLFNILNTIAMMIRLGETAKAQQMATVLGTMFRRFLDLEGEPTVTLEEELQFLDAYLELEQFRFEDRLELSRNVDPAALQARLPTLILQPVAENAVKHGVSCRAGRSRMELEVRIDGRTLEIDLTNDAAPSVGDRGDNRGIGVNNIRSRLREMYGDRASFELTMAADRTRARMRIPYETHTRTDS